MPCRSEVRRYLKEGLARDIPLENDPLTKIVGMIKDGPVDGAERHDEHLYDISRPTTRRRPEMPGPPG